MCRNLSYIRWLLIKLDFINFTSTYLNAQKKEDMINLRGFHTHFFMSKLNSCNLITAGTLNCQVLTGTIIDDFQTSHNAKVLVFFIFGNINIAVFNSLKFSKLVGIFAPLACSFVIYFWFIDKFVSTMIKTIVGGNIQLHFIIISLPHPSLLFLSFFS